MYYVSETWFSGYKTYKGKVVRRIHRPILRSILGSDHDGIRVMTPDGRKLLFSRYELQPRKGEG